MSRSVLVVIAFAACSRSDEAFTPGPPVTAHPAPERIPPGAPHGHIVSEIAVTEEADAALTADLIGGVRLWPTLDGKRPPVPIAAVAPRDLAIAHAGEQFLVAIIDHAGTVRLLRVGRDGTVFRRTQLDSDALAQQIVAVGSSVLVRRADQSIEKFDANAMSRGKLLAQAGERITTIAARRGSALALIATTGTAALDHNSANTLRWIVATDELRWGTSVVLPEAVESDLLALSPDHRRVAVANLRGSELSVYAIDPVLKPVFGTSKVSLPDNATMGFFDDDRVVVVTMQLQWWLAGKQQDPWAKSPSALSPPPPTSASSDAGAIGDRLVVTSRGAGLALSDQHETKYLGWSDIASGAVTALDSSIAFSTNNARISWLDDHLAYVRDYEHPDEPLNPAGNSTPIGPHQVVRQLQVDHNTAIEVIDTEQPTKPLEIGKFSSFELVQYFPRAGVLVVSANRIVHRYQLDFARHASSELPRLKPTGSLSQLWLTEPARANGIIAVGYSWDDDSQQRLQIFREGKPGSNTVSAESSALGGSLMLVDSVGTMFVRTPSGAIVAKRAGKQVAKLDVAANDNVTISDDGARFAVIKTAGLAVLDLAGKPLWEITQWGVLGVTFAYDGRSVIVQTRGGLLLLDAATGARLGVACAWGFGLHVRPLIENTFGVPPLCEDGS